MRMRNSAGAAALALMVAVWAAPAGAQDTVRAEVGKPLLAAKSAMAAHNFAKASAALRQAEAVPGKTAHESLLVAQMRASLAQASGDTATAAKAYQVLIDSGQIGATQELALMQAEVSIAFKDKNYANVVYWAERYLKANPGSAEMRTSQIQGYYLQGKYLQAAKLQQLQIQAETKSGHPPSEVQLQLLYSCQNHLNDKVGALATIKQLVAYYPKPDYWLNVIDTLRTKPGFADRLLVEVYRLEFSLGLVNKPDDAMDLAELTLQAKLPGESKDVVDKSFAGGLLGTGAEAARHQRLKTMVDKSYAQMQTQLGKDDADAETDHDGNRLLGLGETYVSYGMFDKGIPMMEEAIRKDELRHSEDAKLQLGLAYLKAGNKKKAVAELRTVGGTEGVGDLAQLWILHIGKV
jgi:tetratricopeptide (TPR) repeat protein